jgi:sugar phosphate isomerase/epimerase
MRFAINYSPQAQKLWQDGQIQIDLFKCPDWRDLVAKVGELHKLYVHCSLITWRGELQNIDFALLQRWLDTTDTLAINTHFALAQSDFPPNSRITAEAVVEHALRVLSPLCERFGAENIIIENMPYPAPAGVWQDAPLKEVVDPAVISEIVSRSGCGLLLDIAHAIRACEGTGRKDPKAYLNALPVRALRELHVVGILPEPDEDGIRHDHFAMTETDWEITEWALKQIRIGAWRKPDTLAFEYGGVGNRFAWRSEAAVIAAQTPRLYQLAKSV